MASIVIAAGGTGGHIYPGLALAAALRAVDPDVRITFVGTPRGLEQRLIPAEGYDLRLVDMVPFTGWRRFVLPLALLRAAAQSRRILRTVGADAVAGMGGYPSIPVILGARLARVPSVIHESGAVSGRANRISARFTANVALSFDKAAAGFPKATTRTVGMPLGPDIAGFDRAGLRARARAEFGVAEGVTLVMVNGGSQGSVRLNTAAVELAGRWKDRDDVRLVIKTGRDHTPTVEAALRENGGDRIARPVTYFDRMDTAYAAADIAICRAGAGTVAELAVTALPAVLVPYPHAPDDHQTVNASVLVDARAAVMVRDEEATGERIGAVIEELLADPSRLPAMAAAARATAHPGAAEALAAWVFDLAGKG